MIHSLVKDPLLRRLVKNASVLFSGNVTASLLGLASLVITARALSVEQFGMLVLVTTYVLIVDRLINFQSWQALIKYGADALEHKRDEDFKSLIKFGFILDGSTAILGAIVAASAAWIVGGWLEWSEEHVWMAVAYSGTVLFHIKGTPIAILRLFDRFKKTAIQQAFAAAIKLVGVTIAYLIDANLWAFLFVWAIVDIGGNILLLYFSLKELIIRKVTGVSQANVSGMSARFSGIWVFVWVTNLNSSIRMTSRELDVMIIAAVLGPAPVGLYKVAKQFTSVIQKTIDPLYQAIYPELAKLYSLGRLVQFVTFSLRSGLFAGLVAFAIWLGFFMMAEYVIGWTVGSKYLDATDVMLWYMMAAVIAAAAFPLQPAMLSMGRPHATFWVHIASTVIYFTALLPLLYGVGLVGAGIAYVVYYAVWSLMMFSIEAKILTARMRKDAA